MDNILVIERNRSVLKSIRDFLKAEGYRMRKTSPDLVVFSSRCEIPRELKKKGIPIVFLAEYDTLESEQSIALKKGVSSCMKKPIDLGRLLTEICDLLKSKR